MTSSKIQISHDLAGLKIGWTPLLVRGPLESSDLEIYVTTGLDM